MPNDVNPRKDRRFFGCRFSLYPMTDRFVDVILGAVENLRRPGVEIDTDDISTCLIGPENTLFTALRDCLKAAADTEHHVVLTATFSKG